MEDMRAASTGLVDLPEQATNQATAPIRIPIPEMRRPSLPPGRGSLAEMHSAGKSSLPRQLSTHPSHATPPGALIHPVSSKKNPKRIPIYLWCPSEAEHSQTGESAAARATQGI